MTDNGSSRARTDAAADDTGDAKAGFRSRLRQARRERRDATSPQRRVADGLRLLEVARPLIEQATCVASFEPKPTEVNVAALNEHVLAAGARLIVPITLDDLDLSWRDVATGVDLGRGGIAEADVIIAPALAIGPGGERLGQGGGCYDRALPRRRPGTPVVATVFASENGLDLPVEAHDERVDGVLTQDGLTAFTNILKY